MGIGTKCLEIRGFVPFSRSKIGSLVFGTTTITLAYKKDYLQIKWRISHKITNMDYLVMLSLLWWELAPSVWRIGQKPHIRVHIRVHSSTIKTGCVLLDLPDSPCFFKISPPSCRPLHKLYRMKAFTHISTNIDYFVMPSLLQWELAPSVWRIGQKPNVRV